MLNTSNDLEQLIEAAADTMTSYPDEREFIETFVARLRRAELDDSVYQAVMALMDEWEQEGAYTGQSGGGYWDAAAWNEARVSFPCTEADLMSALDIFMTMEDTFKKETEK